MGCSLGFGSSFGLALSRYAPIAYRLGESALALNFARKYSSPPGRNFWLVQPARGPDERIFLSSLGPKAFSPSLGVGAQASVDSTMQIGVCHSF
jgi:hypothetical protein